MSEKSHQDAIIALLNAATPSATAYSLDALAKMSTTPSSYNEVIVLERPTEGFRLGGRPDRRAWRVLTRAVATTAGSAQEMRRRAAAALEDQWLTIDGVETTPIERAVGDDPIAADSGWWSGVTEWTYNA